MSSSLFVTLFDSLNRRNIGYSTLHVVAVHALVGALLTPALVVAQEATVKVGNLIKRTTGTVTSLEAGDVACYLHMTDSNGKAFQEFADFDICEQKPSLKGKRVALTYRESKVMSDECQGNPACKKTRTVALVVAAKAVNVPAGNSNSASTPKAVAAGGQTALSAQRSFCTPLETVVFACRTGAKLVSVCASKDAGPNRGYVQYRFGKPDAPEPLEIMLPEAQMTPAKAANGENFPFAGGGGAWLRFRKGEYGYVVYSGIGRWGPKGETREKQGLVVQRGAKQIAHLKCTGPLTSELGPDWLGKVGIVAGKEEFDFPD